MAVKLPVKWTGSGFRWITSQDQINIREMITYQYGENPSVTLDVIPSGGGNLNGMTDTRLIAGNYLTSTGDGTSGDDGALEYPQESETEDVSTISTDWQRLQLTIDSSIPQATPDMFNLSSWPLYESDGNLRAMNHQDLIDTFVYNAIGELVGSTLAERRAGTYYISTDSSELLNDLVSPYPVFVDTRADSSAYTAGGIPEDLDQPKTVNDYLLMRIRDDNPPSGATMPPNLLYHDSVGDIRTIPIETQNNMFQHLVRWAVVNEPGWKIGYQIDSSGGSVPGVTRGTGMTDTKLNGSGDYQTRFVGTNDYRAQEFPDGTPVTQNTWYLKIYRG